MSGTVQFITKEVEFKKNSHFTQFDSQGYLQYL